MHGEQFEILVLSLSVLFVDKTLKILKLSYAIGPAVMENSRFVQVLITFLSKSTVIF